MRIYRSWHRCLGATLGVLLAAAVPSRAEKVLKVIPSADIGQLDPDLAANLIGRTYAQMVFDTLFALDHNMAPKPMMVESEAVSPDRLTYRFTLRPGAYVPGRQSRNDARRHCLTATLDGQLLHRRATESAPCVTDR